MKKYLILTTFGLLLICIFLTIFLGVKNKNIQKELSITKANEKAFVMENSILKDKNRVYQFTIEQLNYFNDSIINKMDSIRKVLKIKDKDIKQLQYLLSKASKTDTIICRDTIFKEPSFKMDTLIGDKWYSLNLNMAYPSTIIVSPTFQSEKILITNIKKETINPPKKCAFLRWFQKNHTVLEMEVVEENPYIINTKTKFIEIIK